MSNTTIKAAGFAVSLLIAGGLFYYYSKSGSEALDQNDAPTNQDKNESKEEEKEKEKKEEETMIEIPKEVT